MTIGNWIMVGIIALLGITAFVVCLMGESKGGAIASLIITVLIIVGFIAFETWYHKSTASGIRYYKDFESEMANLVILHT